MLRRLYDWTLAKAAGPGAERWLAGISFADSSFFPVPPDVMQIPMSIARPERSLRYAVVSTVASVAGALLGYLIFTVGLGIGDSNAFDLGGIFGAIIGVVILLPFVGIFARLRRGKQK